MGYSYSMDGKLCCDRCGVAGGVRKRHCPYRHCPAAALCAPCLREVKANGQWKEAHQHCKAGAEAFIRRQQKTQALLDSGQAVRGSALREGDNVRVWFYYADGVAIERVMARETYNAIDLLEPATVADFEQHGPVWAEPKPEAVTV